MALDKPITVADFDAPESEQGVRYDESDDEDVTGLGPHAKELLRAAGVDPTTGEALEDSEDAVFDEEVIAALGAARRGDVEPLCARLVLCGDRVRQLRGEAEVLSNIVTRLREVGRRRHMEWEERLESLRKRTEESEANERAAIERAEALARRLNSAESSRAALERRLGETESLVVTVRKENRALRAQLGIDGEKVRRDAESAAERVLQSVDHRQRVDVDAKGDNVSEDEDEKEKEKEGDSPYQGWKGTIQPPPPPTRPPPEASRTQEWELRVGADIDDDGREEEGEELSDDEAILGRDFSEGGRHSLEGVRQEFGSSKEFFDGVVPSKEFFDGVVPSKEFFEGVPQEFDPSKDSLEPPVVSPSKDTTPFTSSFRGRRPHRQPEHHHHHHHPHQNNYHPSSPKPKKPTKTPLPRPASPASQSSSSYYARGRSSSPGRPVSYRPYSGPFSPQYHSGAVGGGNLSRKANAKFTSRILQTKRPHRSPSPKPSKTTSKKSLSSSKKKTLKKPKRRTHSPPAPVPDLPQPPSLDTFAPDTTAAMFHHRGLGPDSVSGAGRGRGLRKDPGVWKS